MIFYGILERRDILIGCGVFGASVGEVHVISLVSKTVVHCLKVGKGINAIKFSPNGEHFAVAKEGTGKFLNDVST